MICTDIFQQAIDLCNKRLPDATSILVKIDDSKLPVNSNSQSIELCVGVPPTIKSDWIVHESHRVLKPRGVLVFTFWNKYSLRGILTQYTAEYRNEYE